jgi:heme/copper-type cytochrome/quinol oxidase subunit 4
MAVTGIIFQQFAKWHAPQIASPAIPFIIVFFFCLTLFSLYVVLKTSSNKKFIFSYILSRIIKLAAIMLFLILYIILNKEDRWNFAIAFLIIYFFYSTFEIFALKKNNEKSL